MIAKSEVAAEMPRDKIFLVGFMGSGKSTVGPLVAARLGWDFIDLDRQIEREQGKLIREIFEQDGEPAFRRIEACHLRSLKDRAACVVALGGGAFVQEGGTWCLGVPRLPLGSDSNSLSCRWEPPSVRDTRSRQRTLRPPAAVLPNE